MSDVETAIGKSESTTDRISPYHALKIEKELADIQAGLKLTSLLVTCNEPTERKQEQHQYESAE